MKIESPRFGTLVIEPERIIDFPRGLVGFESCRRYSLFHPEGGQPGHFILQSLDDPALAFHVGEPSLFGFEREIALSDEEAADLALAAGEPRLVGPGSSLAVAVTLSKEGGDRPLRANLNAPLVINAETRRGVQHVFVAAEPAT